MIRSETEAERDFRASVRDWLENNLPQSLSHLTFRPPPAEIMPWYKALAARGWIAPHWPKAHGGMEASAVEQVILIEELTRAGAPDVPSQGLNHIGPMLIKRGTEAQKAQHLPRILNGDTIWCQGYSEPGAGSDLAGLATRARIDGDDLVIDGHKIWTSWAHHAQWMFALVRTGGARRKGITFVLIDLATPGITCRPIRTIAGDNEFAEVFLDGVRVPQSNIIGEIDDGWNTATSLLAEERLHIGSPLHVNRAFRRLEALVERMEGGERAAWNAHLLEAEIAVETVTAAFLDSSERQAAGIAADGEGSYLKLLGTEATQRILDLAQRAAGHIAARAEPLLEDGRNIDLNDMFLQSRRLGIYGGSNEIQLTLLATRVLGLGGGRG